jgi:hypothetical protein
MMTHPPNLPQNMEISSHAVCTCGSSSYFYSEMEPPGYFCIECGKPDPITQRSLEIEEPGYWGL